MAGEISIDISPPKVSLSSGQTTFDRDLFRKSIPVLAARVPASQTTKFLKAEALRGTLLNIPKKRSVEPDPSDPSGRLVLLRVSDDQDLSLPAKEFIKKEGKGLTKYVVELDYDYWGADEILLSLFPDDLQESPTSFTITGHLAHFNLREEHLLYKHIIGQVVLDKHKSLRTVVNKLDNISNEFRFFKMEVLAGEPDFMVTAIESNCKFTFDFSTVYWNSRLHTEHERLVALFQPGDIIADVFAGVGPFAVPAGKKGCRVFANDLNPSSALYMQKNVDDNRVTNRVRVTNVDGREFIRSVPTEAWNYTFPPEVPTSRRRGKEKQVATLSSPNPTQVTPKVKRRIDHFVMNLPGTALEFLDAFRGLLTSLRNEPGFEEDYDVMPMIHCHCFTRELERPGAERDIRTRAEEALGHALTDEVSFHLVRRVAPNKDMYCLSFRLPRELALEAHQ